MARMGTVLLGAVLFSAALGAEPLIAQDLKMNFFVMPTPATGSGPLVRASDSQCQNLAYAAGYGADHRWRSYVTGTEADGEAAQVARNRIGSGPWFNYYGQLIAEDLAQLHSDQSGLNQSTAVTLAGQVVSPEVLQVPPGSRLDGSAFTRGKAYLCFGIPG